MFNNLTPLYSISTGLNRFTDKKNNVLMDIEVERLETEEKSKGVRNNMVNAIEGEGRRLKEFNERAEMQEK